MNDFVGGQNSQCRLSSRLEKGVGIFSFTGYFDGETGDLLLDRVHEFFAVPCRLFIFDFSKCTLINSLGVSRLLKISLEITEEVAGKIYITGLDELKGRVFELSGVNLIADIVGTIDEAMQFLVPAPD